MVGGAGELRTDSGGAGEAVDHQPLGLDAAGRHERREREDRGGREAARVGDEARRTQRRPVKLGNAVDGLFGERPISVLRAVDALPGLPAPQAERGAEVDDAGASVEEAARRGDRGLGGDREQHHVARRRLLRRHEFDAEAVQIGVVCLDRPRRSARGPGHLQLRVLERHPERLAAHVPARSQNADSRCHETICITQ